MATQRLPIPGQDDGSWGDILNGFLGVSLDAGGNLLPSAVSSALPSPIPSAKLGSGSASSSTFLRGDGTWATPPTGGGTVTAVTAADSTITVGGSASAPTIGVNAISEGKVTNLTTDLAARAPLASPTFTGKVTTPALQVTTGAGSASQVLTSDSSGNATWADPRIQGVQINGWPVQTGAVNLSVAQGLIPTAVKTSAYTAVSGDFVPVDATGASVTITLPTSQLDQTRIGVKLIAVTGTNAVTIAAGGSDVFNKASGATTLSLTLQNQGVILQYAAIPQIWYVVDDSISLAALNASLAGTYAGINNSPTTQTQPVPGTPAVIGSYMTANGSGPQTSTGTSRAPFQVGVTGTNIRCVFANWYVDTSLFSDHDNAASITIKASVEIGAVIYPLTFSGRNSVVIDGGGFVVSDPLGAEITAGTVLYVRTFMTPTTNWYYNRWSYFATGTGGFTATTDLTPAGSAAIADGANKALYMPSMITIEPTTSSKVSAQVIGDSIGHGANDGVGTSYQGRNTGNPALGGGGFIQRAFYGVGGILNSAVPSDTAHTFITTTAGHLRRFIFALNSTVLICQYGRNDVSNGRTLTQIQPDLLAIWTLGAGRGRRVYQTTITPLTTSTDGWLTTTNQTPIATESVRLALNAWIRAGAPIDPTTKAAVAIGTTGALVAGAAGHPLVNYIEVANTVETAQNSGIWKARVNTRAVSDAVTAAAGYTVNSASGNFTSADLGRTITVAGAGTSGALYIGVISTIYSGTSIGLTSATPSAVSAAAATVGDSYTRDGTHPDVYGAIQASASITPASL